MYKLQLWDTAGVERFMRVTSSYYRNADGVFVVYDTNDRDSFDNVPNWMGEIEKYSGENCNKIVLGNKTDLVNRRMISEEDGSAESNLHGSTFFETSALDGSNVQNAMTAMVSEIKSKR